jgi:hypothetical protein
MQRKGRGAVLVAVAATLAGCGGSTNGSRSPADRSSTARDPASVSTGAGRAAPADPATRAAVATAYRVLFSYRSTSQQSQDALQHGDRFAAVLDEQSENGYAENAAATVTSVRLVSPDVARVVFTISSGGSALLKDTPGVAVREGGTWKVAAQTFCALLGLEGAPPAACNDPSVTALPTGAR